MSGLDIETLEGAAASFSPGGASVHSQGCEPLEGEAVAFPRSAEPRRNGRNLPNKYTRRPRIPRG